MGSKNKAKAILNQLTPDQQAFTRHVAELKVNNKLMEKQLEELKSAYDELYKVMIVILHASGDKGLMIHESQFMRFKDEYRIETKFDDKKREMSLKLKTLFDKE